MTKLIRRASEQMYEKVKDDIKDSLISVLFDSASRNRRHVLGVTVRYYKDKKINERVLGVITLHERQTSEALADRVRNLLNKVGKTEIDIFCSTTDNGANMLKATDIMLAAQSDSTLLTFLDETGMFSFVFLSYLI